LTALLITAAACSGADEPTDPPPAAPETRAGSAAPRAEDPSDGGERTAGVLGFSAPQLGGGTIEGRDYSGRDVAFWFWAPW
jgi:hypothetical protein